VRLAEKRSSILEVGHKVYEGLVIFYPKDLRGDFGDEMIEVFDEKAWEAYSCRGLSALLRVWFNATWEIITVALPARIAERGIPVIAVTATLAFMLWFASYISYVMETACSGCRIN
jgi:hypothetical protein